MTKSGLQLVFSAWQESNQSFHTFEIFEYEAYFSNILYRELLLEKNEGDVFVLGKCVFSWLTSTDLFS